MPSRKCGRFDYDAIRDEARKPVRDRAELIITAKGKRKPRRYDLSEGEIIRLMESWMNGNGFPNPMKRKGPFYGFIEALKHLGIDKVHSYVSVMQKMREIIV